MEMEQKYDPITRSYKGRQWRGKVGASTCICLCFLLVFIAGCTKVHPANPAMTDEMQKLIQEELAYYKEFLELAKPLVEIASDEDQSATERYTQIVEAVKDEEFIRSYQDVLDYQKKIINLDDVDSHSLAAFAGGSDANIRLLTRLIEIEAEVTEMQKETGKDFETCAKSCLSQGLSTRTIEHIEDLVKTFELALSGGALE